MKRSRRWSETLLLILTVCTREAQAQGGLDRDSLRLYGGTYMSDCRNNAAPRLTVFAAVEAIQGDKRVAGSNVRAAHAYFGTPPDYLVAQLSDVRGQQLVAIISRERAGQALTIHGEPLRTAFGKRFRP